MMHQPVDDDDVRFYAVETLLIPNGNGRCAVLGAPYAARTGGGAPLSGAQGGHKGHASARDGQPAPPRRRAAPRPTLRVGGSRAPPLVRGAGAACSTRSRAGGHPAPRTGAKRP
jgi:hypothetical protein